MIRLINKRQKLNKKKKKKKFKRHIFWGKIKINIILQSNFCILFISLTATEIYIFCCCYYCIYVYILTWYIYVEKKMKKINFDTNKNHWWHFFVHSFWFFFSSYFREFFFLLLWVSNSKILVTPKGRLMIYIIPP